MLVSVTDTLEIRDAKETAEGYLALDGAIARTGIYHYLGAELGGEFADMGMVAVFRPESSVFNDAAMARFAHKPITDDHPTVNVTKANWKDLSKGWSGGEIVRDGEKVSVPMIMADADLISKYRAGKVELSPGYTADVIRQDGQMTDGTRYQAVMGPPLSVNHIAVVSKGRGGPSIRLGDAWPSTPTAPQKDASPMPKTLLVDGIPVADVSDAAEAVITKLQGIIAARDTALADAGTKIGELTAAVSTKDGEIVGLNAKLKDADLTPDKLDAAVAARGLVVAGARSILGDAFDPKGLTDAEIRKQAVVKKIGDDAAALDDAGIIGAFKALTAGVVVKDTIRETVMSGGGAAQMTDAAARADAARQAMIDSLNPKAEAAN